MLINSRYLFILTIIYCNQVLITFRTIISYMIWGWPKLFYTWLVNSIWNRVNTYKPYLVYYHKMISSTTYYLQLCWWQKIHNKSNKNQVIKTKRFIPMSQVLIYVHALTKSEWSKRITVKVLYLACSIFGGN